MGKIISTFLVFIFSFFFIGYDKINILSVSEVFASPVKSEAWEVLGVEGISDGVADWSSLIVTYDGKPYIAYSDKGSGGKAIVKVFNGKDWESVGGFVSEDFAEFVTMKRASDGILYVAYRDLGVKGKATVKRFYNGSWEFVGARGFTGGNASYISIALDSKNTPYVAFQDGNSWNRAVVAKYNEYTKQWDTVGFPGFSRDNAEETTIAIDFQDNIYVIYRELYYGGEAVIKKFTDEGVWSIVGGGKLSRGTAAYFSLEFDQHNNLYVAFSDDGLDGKVSVRTLSDKNYWLDIGIAGISVKNAHYTKMLLDYLGNIYIAYQDLGVKERVVTKLFNGSHWVDVGEPVSSGSGQYVSLAIDIHNEIPYVAFRDNTHDGKAVIKKFHNPLVKKDWQIVAARSLGVGAAKYTSLTMNNDNILYATHSDSATFYKAMVEKYNPIEDTWNYLVYDLGDGAIATDLSIEIDLKNDIHIIYTDTLYDAGVIVDKWDDESYKWIRLGDVAHKGKVDFTTLTFDNDNIPHAAFATNNSVLSVKYFDGKMWQYKGQTIIDKVSAGAEIKASKATGYLFLAYISDIPNLKYFNHIDNIWENLGEMPFENGSYKAISLTIDDNYKPIVAYIHKSTEGINKIHVLTFITNNWYEMGEQIVVDDGVVDLKVITDKHRNVYVTYTDAATNPDRNIYVKRLINRNWIDVGMIEKYKAFNSHLSIAIDSDGIPYISFPSFYSDGRINVLKFDDIK